MSKTVFLGVEGSGKTTLTMALARAFESHKSEGWYLKPLSRDSFRFLKTLPETLDGNFPSQTADLRELRWQAEYKGHDLGEIAILDYPGEIYRLAFLDEKDERDPEAFRQKVASNKPEIDALLGAIKEAEDVFVLFNLADGMDLRNNPRNLDAVWVTNECLKLLKRLESKPRIRLLFTQVDRYRDAGLDLSSFSPKSIDLIGHDHSDVPWSLVSIVDAPESEYGVEKIVAHLEETCKNANETSTLLNTSLPVVEGTPLPNLDVTTHVIERKGANGFLQNISMALLMCFLIGCSGTGIFAFICFCGNSDIEALAVFAVSLTISVFPALFLCCIRRYRIKETSNLLRSFACGAWDSAMRAKNVYTKDSFVLYYAGIGNLYGLGGARQNYAKAERLFSASANEGNSAALIALGWMAENGWGKPKNMSLAQKLYKEAKEEMHK